MNQRTKISHISSWKIWHPYLAVIAETEEELIKRLNEWKYNVESKGKRVNMNKTDVMISGERQKAMQKAVRWPCGVDSRPFHCQVTTLGKLFTHGTLCQAVGCLPNLQRPTTRRKSGKSTVNSTWPSFSELQERTNRANNVGNNCFKYIRSSEQHKDTSDWQGMTSYNDLTSQE